MFKHTISRITEYIVATIDPEEVLLFGSLAYGKADIYSDVDLIIITRFDQRRNDGLKQGVKTFINEFSLKPDVHIHSEKEIKEAQKKPFSFLGSVLKNGKIIYKKNGLNIDF